jgi:hypothetical protein
MADACIYLVANNRSRRDFTNLVYSINNSGCKLPIFLIPFGGQPILAQELPSSVEIVDETFFPHEARDFVNHLSTKLYCPRGFLLRFLPFFGKYERFIYSDNDVVALCNWEEFIEKLDHCDIVHADEEYTTGSRYNFIDPLFAQTHFGPDFHAYAITAGHFAAKRSAHIVSSLNQALDWMVANHTVCKMHDQTLLQLASYLGNLHSLNLCKPPHGWLSSWSGNYQNTLEILHLLQQGKRISHLHYSGGPTGAFRDPIDELLLSSLPPRSRLLLLLRCSFLSLSGVNAANRYATKLKRKLSL